MRNYFALAFLLLCSCSGIEPGDGFMEGKYDGDLVDGKRHGHGKLTTREGTYIGEFEDNYVNGYGEFTGGDGGSYKGYWVNQEWHGLGQAIWASGDKCICEFKHDKMHGFAFYTRNSGGTYKGYYVNGVKSGIGRIDFVSEKRKGDVYIGEIEDDFMQGHGKYYFSNGDAKEGIFKENKLVFEKPFSYEDSLRIAQKIMADYQRVTNELNQRIK